MPTFSELLCFKLWLVLKYKKGGNLDIAGRMVFCLSNLLSQAPNVKSTERCFLALLAEWFFVFQSVQSSTKKLRKTFRPMITI
jgi:hypothetical protein